MYVREFNLGLVWIDEVGLTTSSIIIVKKTTSSVISPYPSAMDQQFSELRNNSLFVCIFRD